MRQAAEALLVVNKKHLRDNHRLRNLFLLNVVGKPIVKIVHDGSHIASCNRTTRKKSENYYYLVMGYVTGFKVTSDNRTKTGFMQNQR
jgi:hypothetical protein